MNTRASFTAAIAATLSLALSSMPLQAAPKKPQVTAVDLEFAKCLRKGALTKRYKPDTDDAAALIRENCMPEGHAWWEQCQANGAGDRMECGRRMVAMAGMVIASRK